MQTMVQTQQDHRWHHACQCTTQSAESAAAVINCQQQPWLPPAQLWWLVHGTSTWTRETEQQQQQQQEEEEVIPKGVFLFTDSVDSECSGLPG